MKTITANELNLRIKNPDTTLFLLDVREPHEFEICQIPNSQLMPMRSIPDRLDQLPTDVAIITICHHGVRSQQVAQFLLQNGFNDITNLIGGVNAWAADVDRSMPTY